MFMNGKLVVESIAKANGYIKELPYPNKLGLWLNAIKCFLLYGATPSDWKFYEMYKYNHRENKEIITNRKSNELDRLFNPREYAQDFDDKVQFNKLYSSFVRRNWLYTEGKTNSEVEDFIKSNHEVVVKPINLSSGRGIYLYRYEVETIADLLNDLSKGIYLLEQKIELVEELKQLNPESCQTLRITSMVNKSGGVEILAAAIRVGGGKSIVDNFHAKGVAYPIDVNEGIISGLGKDLNNNYYLRHPSTGIVMPGYKIPQWDVIISFVKKAALQNPKARWIGWDVALTPNGCEMVEGNYLVNCNFLQTSDKKGKYSWIKSFL